MGVAYGLQGDRVAAGRAYREVVSACSVSGNAMFGLAASLGLGGVQEAQTELRIAAATYRGVLDAAGDMPFPVATCEANLGLARICYEWNDLDRAGDHWALSLAAAQHLEDTDRFVACQLFDARLRICRGRFDEADAHPGGGRARCAPAQFHETGTRGCRSASARPAPPGRPGGGRAARPRAHPFPSARPG